MAAAAILNFGKMSVTPDWIKIRISVVVQHFYRAMRMHSADYAVARCMSVRLSVRHLSVRLSVCHTPVLSLNGYTYPQFFFTVG